MSAIYFLHHVDVATTTPNIICLAIFLLIADCTLNEPSNIANAVYLNNAKPVQRSVSIFSK